MFRDKEVVVIVGKHDGDEALDDCKDYHYKCYIGEEDYEA